MKNYLWIVIISSILISLILSCSTNNEPVYELTTNAEPAEAGSVTPNNTQANEGETISIQANPNENWVFKEWIGDHIGTENPSDLLMNNDKSVTALFSKREYPLTVTIVGEGSVDERVIQQKSTDYPHGTIVELTAIPAKGWEFVGWAGDVDSNEKIVELTIEAETNVTVSFQEFAETAFPGQTGELVELTVGGATIEVEKINNQYVFQGDILINPDDYAQLDPNKANSETGIDVRTWENNIIPYVIENDVTNALRETIFEGIDMITKNTNISFREYNSDIDDFYLVFNKSNDGTWATALGRNRIYNEHEIFLEEGVPNGTVAHEIMHILGYAHEHSRQDRDEFLLVHLENIQEGKEHNFAKEDWYNPNAPYDYFSLLHYPSHAFLKPNASGSTMTDLDGNTFEYQRDELRESDIEKINELYPIDKPTLSTKEISSIESTSAVSGGNIEGNGGGSVSARGVCWSMSQNPDLDDECTSDGSGTGEFTSNLTGLSADKEYYVRAYATNQQGTGYGEEKNFTTESAEGDWPRDTETEVVDVTNPATGQTWMDRNLGASRAATSMDDEQAYGDLFQWGRAADGHQKRNSGTTSTISSTDTPGHGDFITSSSGANLDWRSPQKDNLWQGINGINNPCPVGYRLPTEAELNAERQSWSSNDAVGAFSSPLKLPKSGYREKYNGSLVGSFGGYWSSTVGGTGTIARSQYLYFESSTTNTSMGSYLRGAGFSVRCIKD